MTAGLPRDFIRTVNSTNPDTNAWALLERSDISPIEFDDRFASESAARGPRVPGADVLAHQGGGGRPGVVVARGRGMAAGLAPPSRT
jgi:putative hydrolase of the HAD superfamily